MTQDDSAAEEGLCKCFNDVQSELNSVKTEKVIIDGNDETCLKHITDSLQKIKIQKDVCVESMKGNS